LNVMALLDQIIEAAKGFEGMLGVSVKHLDSGKGASLNGDELFPTASVFKIPVIVEFYRQLESGEASLDEKVVLLDRDKVPGSGILKELSEGLEITYRDLLELMMILSDNTATDLIVEKVGKEKVNETLRELGLEKTQVVADCRDILFDLVGLSDIPEEEKTIDLFNEKAKEAPLGGTWSLSVEENDVTTPDEMLRLLGMIVEGEAASRESCDAILETMGRCQTGTYRISKYLPSEEIDFAHKTGSLPGIRNDVGVVTYRKTGQRYIVCCFTKDAEDFHSAEETIARASEAIYAYFLSD
jgi:beta-lactamase class A